MTTTRTVHVLAGYDDKHHPHGVASSRTSTGVSLAGHVVEGPKTAVGRYAEYTVLNDDIAGVIRTLAMWNANRMSFDSAVYQAAPKRNTRTAAYLRGLADKIDAES